MVWKQLILIFLGGGIGASARFALSYWVQTRAEHSLSIPFPWAVFTCNLIGCLLIGMSYGWIKAHHPDWIHPLFITGLLGGFTTFSSFALDTQLLIQKQAYLLASLYSIGSLLLGLTLCITGYFFTLKLQTP